MQSGTPESPGRVGIEDAGIAGGDERFGSTDRSGNTDSSTVGIRWGAIAAGALAAVGTFLLLGLLALGIDLLADDTGASDWVSAIIGVISFLVGGYVALTETSPAEERSVHQACLGNSCRGALSCRPGLHPSG